MKLSIDDLDRFRSLNAIFSMSRKEASRVFSPYFVKYHSRLYREKGYLKCILNFVGWWSELLDVEGKDILDVGCGFGVYSLFFSFFGAKHVYGADHNQEKHDLFMKILSMMEPPIKNVSLSLQDGHKLRFSDGRFPIIFIKDVISHVRELDQFLDEVSRILKPGGRILITDENNALDIFGRKARRQIWLSAEERGVKKEDLRAIDQPKTFYEMRREDISGYLADKDLSSLPGVKKIVPGYRGDKKDHEIVLDRLARLTQGLYGDQLIEGTDQILETGELRIEPVFLYRHPRSGDFSEREFNPFWVARELGKHNIQAKVIRPFYSTQKPILNTIGRMIRVTHPLSIIVQPNFYILGTKKLS